jgi:hypothetical protein
MRLEYRKYSMLAGADRVKLIEIKKLFIKYCIEFVRIRGRDINV